MSNKSIGFRSAETNPEGSVKLLDEVDGVLLPISEAMALDSSRNTMTDRRIAPGIAEKLVKYHVDTTTNGRNERFGIELETENKKAIDGFYFHTSDILKALKIEGNFTTDADGIYVAIAQYDNIHVLGHAHTLIMYPVKDDTVVQEYGRVFDYRAPCPCKCPNGKNGHDCS